MHRIAALVLLFSLVLPAGCAIPQPSATPQPSPTPLSISTAVIPTPVFDEDPGIAPRAANTPGDISRRAEPTPVPVTREQVVIWALGASGRSTSDLRLLERRIETVTAERITVAEADRRIGGKAGRDENALVWFVSVRGYFRYEGQRLPGKKLPIYEADGYDAVYDQYTGNQIASRLPGFREVALPAPEVPVADDDGVWNLVGRSVRDVSPILRPRSLPPGFEFVQMIDVGSGTFRVEYTGPGKRLLVGAGAFNPPYWADGEQQTVTVRGRSATLQLKSKTQPSELVQVYWDEPGRWIPAAGAPTKDRVFYMVSAEGLDPDAVLQLADSLREVDQRLEPSPGQTRGWEVYSSTAYDVALRHPPSWKLDPRYTSPDSHRYSGTDGFFMLSASNADTIDEAAESEANHKLRPYGSTPSVTNTKVQGQDARLIMPWSDQASEMESQAALVVVSPRPIRIAGASYKYLVLWADKGHIQAIANTLRFGSTTSGMDQAPTPTAARTLCPVPAKGASDDVPTGVSGRITAVLPEAIKVDSARYGEVIVELWRFARIWKGDYVSAEALEIGDWVDVSCATPRGPEIHANIAKREGTVETVHFEGDTAVLTLTGLAPDSSTVTVLLDRRTQVVANGSEVMFDKDTVQLRPGQQVLAVGVKQKDGVVRGTRVFVLEPEQPEPPG